MDLVTLRRKRGGIKHKLTSFSDFIDPIYEQFSLDVSSLTERIIIEVRSRFEKFVVIDNDFEDLQNQIESLCEEDHLASQYEERDLFYDKYHQTVAKATEILEKLKKPPDSQSSLHLSENQTLSQSQETNFSQVRLPIIDLPKFDGTYDGWLSFKDVFESLIHLNESINDIQKFHYLRASLKDSALRIIQSLDFTRDNYKIAWDLLCKRFDNNRLLINSHLKGIFNLPVVQGDSANVLRDLVDSLFKHLRALNNLGLQTNTWDPLIIYLMTTKLDKLTVCEWEKVKGGTEVPQLDDLVEFLSKRADLLYSLALNAKGDYDKCYNEKNKANFSKDVKPKNVKSFLSNTNQGNSKMKCNFCNKDDHKIYQCPQFNSLEVSERLSNVKRLDLCLNCLCKGHMVAECKSGPCFKCKKKHSRLLHLPEESIALTSLTPSHVLLSTVKLYVYDSSGRLRTCYAILDSGSQSNFISRDLVSMLQLKETDVDIAISGITSSISHLRTKCHVQIQSIVNDFNIQIPCLVLPKISNHLPNTVLDVSMLKIPNDVKLADPNFNKPKRIDLLIGASLFWESLRPQRITLGRNLPILQETVFGYTISGCLDHRKSINRSVSLFVSNVDLNESLQKFWMIEEINKKSSMTSEELRCEEFFQNTFSRTTHGRFVVRLPFKDDVAKLGSSKDFAVKRLLSLEKRFDKNSKFKVDYDNFIKEYIDLGHMSLVKNLQRDEISHFLPHHAVFKEDSLTTKVRVVFNGSAPTSTGYSINDLQFAGPQILNSLFDTLIKFRQYQYVVTSDITKMYRQVLIHEDDRKWQRIVWRFRKTDDIQVYNLNTVTYGTTSAPYLAMRCLQQFAFDCRNEYPTASKMILENFYVDDLIVGFESEHDAGKVCSEIVTILRSGCFELRKWRSNSLKFLNNFKGYSTSSDVLNICDKETRCLGIQWCSSSDTLSFQFKDLIPVACCTKRQVLSSIAKLYDPLGLISPCTVLGKRLIQLLWSLQLDWDVEIPNDLKQKWIIFQQDLGNLMLLKIPRLTLINHRGMNLAKAIVRQCVTCFKLHPKSPNVLMGDLPFDRVNVLSPFAFTGLYYAGPFRLKDRKSRGCRIRKAYVCLFICLSTKAVHLELISDLTFEAFIAGLRRFSARRGFPSDVYSDNGTNFVGASKILSEMSLFLSQNEDKIQDYAIQSKLK